MKLSPEWSEILKEEFAKEYMKVLQASLKEAYKNEEIYPPKELIFRAFQESDFSKIKVVILGQDCYHGPGQANGLAFAVNNEIKIPPSLKNIFKEMSKDFTPPSYPNLLGWSRQGVMLLNTVLTVKRGIPNSHKGIGWENFTDFAISKLGERKEPIVFILWGNQARSKKSLIKKKHKIIESAHPSPLSAYNGFFDSRPFFHANQFLSDNNLETIDWSKSMEE